MAYDEGAAHRIREVLEQIDAVVEKKMFGGLAFMIDGNMSCGVVGSELMLRIHPDQYENALKQPFARIMDFTGRPMRGFIFVGVEGFSEDEDLNRWINLSLDYIKTLPRK